jgi:hypothetical protein
MAPEIAPAAPSTLSARIFDHDLISSSPSLERVGADRKVK